MQARFPHTRTDPLLACAGRAGLSRNWHVPCGVAAADLRRARGAMSGHLRVLVVEDDANIGELIVELLWSEGFPTRRVEDGRAAIAALHEEQPLALIVDMGLPLVDGGEVARTSRRMYDGHVPIIVVTAD